MTCRRFPRIYQPIQQDEEYLVSRLDNKMVITPALLGQLFAAFSHSHFSTVFFLKKNIVSSRVGVFISLFWIFFSHNKKTKRDFLVFLNHTLSETTQFLPILVFSLSKYNTDSNIRSIRYHRSNYINVKF